MIPILYFSDRHHSADGNMLKESTYFSCIWPNNKDCCKEKDSKNEVDDDEVVIIKEDNKEDKVVIIKEDNKEDKVVIIKEVNCPDSRKGVLYHIEVEIDNDYKLDKRDKEGWYLI